MKIILGLKLQDRGIFRILSVAIFSMLCFLMGHSLSVFATDIPDEKSVLEISDTDDGETPKPSGSTLPDEPLLEPCITEDIEIDRDPDVPPPPIPECHEPDGVDDAYNVSTPLDYIQDNNAKSSSHDNSSFAILYVRYLYHQQQELAEILTTFEQKNSSHYTALAQRIVGPWETASWKKSSMPELPDEPLPTPYTAEDIEIDRTPYVPPRTIPESHEPTGEDDSLPPEATSIAKPSMRALPDEPLPAPYTAEDIEVDRTPDVPPPPIPESHEPTGENDSLPPETAPIAKPSMLPLLDEPLPVPYTAEDIDVDQTPDVPPPPIPESHDPTGENDSLPPEAASIVKPSMLALSDEPLPVPYTAEDVEVDRTPDVPPPPIPESHEPTGEDDSLKVATKDDKLDKDGVHGDDGDMAPPEAASVVKPSMLALSDEPLPVPYTAEDIDVDQTPDVPPPPIPESHDPTEENDSLPPETAPIAKPSMPPLPDEPLPVPYTAEDIDVDQTPDVPPPPIPESHDPTGKNDSLPPEAASIVKPSMLALSDEPLPVPYTAEDVEVDQTPHVPPPPIPESHELTGEDNSSLPPETASIAKPPMLALPYEPLPASYIPEDVELDRMPDVPPPPIPESHEPDGEDNSPPPEATSITKPSMLALPDEPLPAPCTAEDLEIDRTPCVPPRTIPESHEPDGEDNLLPPEAASIAKPPMLALPDEPLPAPYIAEDIEVDQTPHVPPPPIPESHEPTGEDDSLKVAMKDDALDRDGVHGDDGDVAPPETASITKPSMLALSDEPLPAPYTAEDIEIDRTPDVPPRTIPESHVPTGGDDSLPPEATSIAKPSMLALPDEPLPAPYIAEDIEVDRTPDVPPPSIPECHEPDGEDDVYDVDTAWDCITMRDKNTQAHNDEKCSILCINYELRQQQEYPLISVYSTSSKDSHYVVPPAQRIFGPWEAASWKKPPMPELPDEPLPAPYVTKDIEVDRTPNVPPPPIPESHEPTGEDDSLKVAMRDDKLDKDGVHGDDGDVAPPETASITKPSMPALPDEPLPAPHTAEDIELDQTPNVPPPSIPESHEPNVEDDSLPPEAASIARPSMLELPDEPLPASYTAEDIEIDRTPHVPPPPIPESHEPTGEDDSLKVAMKDDALDKDGVHGDDSDVAPPETASIVKPSMLALPDEPLPEPYMAEDIEVDRTPDVPPPPIPECHEPDGEDDVYDVDTAWDSIMIRNKNTQTHNDEKCSILCINYELRQQQEYPVISVYSTSSKDSHYAAPPAQRIFGPWEAASWKKPPMPELPDESLPAQYTAEDIEVDRTPNVPPLPIPESHEPTGEDDSLKVAMKDDKLDKDGVHGDDGDVAPPEAASITKPSMPALPDEPLPAPHTAEDIEIDRTPCVPPPPIPESHEPTGEDDSLKVAMKDDALDKDGVHGDDGDVAPPETASIIKPSMPALHDEPLPVPYTPEDIELDLRPDAPSRPVPESHEPDGEDDSLKVAMKDDKLDKDGVHGDDGDVAPPEAASIAKPSMLALHDEPLPAPYVPEDIEIDQTPHAPPPPIPESHEPTGEDNSLKVAMKDDALDKDGVHGDDGDVAPQETESILKPSMLELPDEPLPAPYTPEDIELDLRPDAPSRPVPESHEPDGEDDSLKVAMEDDKLDKDGVHGDDGDVAPPEAAAIAKPSMMALPDEPLPSPPEESFADAPDVLRPIKRKPEVNDPPDDEQQAGAENEDVEEGAPPRPDSMELMHVTNIPDIYDAISGWSDCASICSDDLSHKKGGSSGKAAIRDSSVGKYLFWNKLFSITSTLGVRGRQKGIDSRGFVTIFGHDGRLRKTAEGYMLIPTIFIGYTKANLEHSDYLKGKFSGSMIGAKLSLTNRDCCGFSGDWRFKLDLIGSYQLLNTRNKLYYPPLNDTDKKKKAGNIDIRSHLFSIGAKALVHLPLTHILSLIPSVSGDYSLIMTEDTEYCLKSKEANGIICGNLVNKSFQSANAAIGLALCIGNEKLGANVGVKFNKRLGGSQNGATDYGDANYIGKTRNSIEYNASIHKRSPYGQFIIGVSKKSGARSGLAIKAEVSFGI